MRLRTAALIAFVALVGAVVAAIAFSVSTVVDRSARQVVESDLTRSSHVFKDLLAYQRSQLENDARVVADEPRTRALFGGDVDLETIRGGARRIHERLGSALFLLSDEDGFLLVDVEHPEDSGENLLENPVTGPVFSAALENGSASGVWTKGESVFRVQSQAIRFGQEVRGVVLLGEPIGDAEATTLEAQTGSAVVLLKDGAVVGLSSGLTDRQAVAAGLAGSKGEAPTEVGIGGRRYLVTRAALPGYVGDHAVDYAVVRDIEVALTPGRRMMRILYMVFGVAVLVALLLSLLLSRRLSRPLDALVAFTADIAAGKLEQRTDIGGLREVKTLGKSMNRMVLEIDESRKQLVEKERLEQELDIAMRIQTSILPTEPQLENLDMAMRMVTADEVGGDYYDIHATDDGGWIAIGDVSGHGLDAGLVMLMAQTSVSTLVRAQPNAKPSTLLASVNETLYENVRQRLGSKRHMTLTLVRSFADGKMVMAGAHMDIIILRAGEDTCEEVRTPGGWIGVIEDINNITVDTEFRLEDGDLIVLYTDGITEATDAGGEMYGFDRVCEAVLATRDKSREAIVDGVIASVEAFQDTQLDDLSLVVARRTR
jgi:sigma-B regulation protein RsbU (phosphoserine phosphatase)